MVTSVAIETDIGDKQQKDTQLMWTAVLTPSSVSIFWERQSLRWDWVRMKLRSVADGEVTPGSVSWSFLVISH